MDNSTSKILNKLGNKKSCLPDIQEAEPLDTPKLQPNSEMAQALSNILGPSFTKEFTPFDQ